ncbi:MAG: hypothetical protein AAFQ81_12135, partial [Pseudomonadota bacterium]
MTMADGGSSADTVRRVAEGAESGGQPQQGTWRGTEPPALPPLTAAQKLQDERAEPQISSQFL